ncbi:MAG: hypothetical protein ACYC91_08985 [Solirubrobacteraceae bacterium]
MEFVVVLAILAIVALFVTAPVRRAYSARLLGGSRRAQAGSTEARLAEDQDRWRASERAELEAARDAKYREIRDAELDHSTGKLSDADYSELDGALRAQAVEILHELDRIEHEQPAGGAGEA